MAAGADGSPVLISLYTGAGGLDLGFEAAGFEVGAAVESDPVACRTLRANRGWPVIERDIHDLPSEELLERAGLQLREVDLLVGGPPCQPFSKSAYWARGDTDRLDDPRADTLTAWLRALRDIRPRAFLLENVAGLVYKNKAEGLLLLHKTIRAINEEMGTEYSFQYQVLNAADFGVPQVRERVFIIGSRGGERFNFPSPTHGCADDLAVATDLCEPRRTAWDAIGDLDDDGYDPELECRGRWARLLPSIPEGENYLFYTRRGGGMPLFGWRRRYWCFLLKLAKDRPAWTIQAQPGAATGPFHWRSRRLSKRELCRLQTFPDDYEITGTLHEAQRQLGNAVPSALGEALAREIRAQLIDGERFYGPLTLIPPRREPVPPPEPVADVPSDYHHLVGDHPDHPGEGKGPAAQRPAD